MKKWAVLGLMLAMVSIFSGCVSNSSSSNTLSNKNLKEITIVKMEWPGGRVIITACPSKYTIPGKHYDLSLVDKKNGKIYDTQGFEWGVIEQIAIDKGDLNIERTFTAYDNKEASKPIAERSNQVDLINKSFNLVLNRR
jgi:hypothetical protein